MICVISSKPKAMDIRTQINFLEMGNEMIETFNFYAEDKDFQEELESNKYLQTFVNGVDEFKNSDVSYKGLVIN